MTTTSFEPTGGYPPLYRKEDTTVDKKVTETRGFSGSIVKISDIMNYQKKTKFLSAFGTEDEDGVNTVELGFPELYESPQKYTGIKYKELGKKKKN